MHYYNSTLQPSVADTTKVIIYYSTPVNSLTALLGNLIV